MVDETAGVAIEADAGNGSEAVVGDAPSAGTISVIVTNLAFPTAVASKRSCVTANPFGGAVSDVTSPTRK